MQAASSVTEPMPTRLGSYTIRERIGSGGVGVVYRASDDTTQSEVAIKTLRCPSAQHRRTIAREVRILTEYPHPGVVRLRDYSLGETPWYAMDLLSGVSLREWLGHTWVNRSTDELSPAELRHAARIARGLCKPLAHLHRNGVVHCDVKPENVFVDSAWNVTLLDFGAARHCGGTFSDSTLECTTYGTWPYMAPECRVGSTIEHHADAYSVGCVLNELVTGHPPPEQTPWKATIGFRSAAPPRRAPAPYRSLIDCLTSVEPSARPELEECAALLDEIATG